jgi:hypothetical protein
MPDETTPDDQAATEEPTEEPTKESVEEPTESTVPTVQLVLPPGFAVPPDGDETDSADDEEEEGASGLIEEPAKVMRIGSMIKRLLDEVRESPLDEAARARLASIHERSLHELEEGLSPDLVDELHRITLPFTDDQTPTDAELRIAQAQLVGWLEGLFHGIQTALVAQQIAAQQQLTQIRRGLPPGIFGPAGPGGAPGAGAQVPGGDEHDQRPTPGQYL